MSEKTMIRTGWALSVLLALFIFSASAAPKLLGLPLAQETMAALGWPTAPVLLIGMMELGFTILFLIPTTGLLGAVLMMGILGGAMATQIRAGRPLFSHTLFSIYLGLFMWGGLWLRDPGFRALFPIRRP
jgi:hypothetical protein